MFEWKSIVKSDSRYVKLMSNSSLGNLIVPVRGYGVWGVITPTTNTMRLINSDFFVTYELFFIYVYLYFNITVVYKLK